MAQANTDSFFNDFLPRLPRLVASNPQGWVIGLSAAELCKLADYACQILLLQKAGLPLTTGAGKTAAALTAAKLTAAEVGPQLLSELQERLASTTVVGQGTDRNSGQQYVSISPLWWAHTHLDSALLYIAE